jgi:hypothetical protein
LTAHVFHALDLTHRVKKLKPSWPVVWGGIHASLLPQQTIQHEAVDYVVVGEGEAAVAALLVGEDHPQIGSKAKAASDDASRRWIPAEQLADPDYSVLDMTRTFEFQGGSRNLDVLTSRVSLSMFVLREYDLQASMEGILSGADRYAPPVAEDRLRPSPHLSDGRELLRQGQQGTRNPGLPGRIRHDLGT